MFIPFTASDRRSIFDVEPGRVAIEGRDGQDLILGYMETTDATGQLPLYNPDTYAQALGAGPCAWPPLDEPR